MIRPAGIPPIVTSKNTIGFLGFGGLWCHSTTGAAAAVVLPPPDAIVVLSHKLKNTRPSLGFLELMLYIYI